MPSGWAAPGGRVANRVAGVRNHACAGGASNAKATSTATRMRLTSFIGVTSWSDGGDGRTGTASRSRRFGAGGAEDASRAKRGDALRRIVQPLAQEALGVLAELRSAHRAAARAAPADDRSATRWRAISTRSAALGVGVDARCAASR